jgi:hypothetical protein
MVPRVLASSRRMLQVGVSRSVHRRGETKVELRHERQMVRSAACQWINHGSAAVGTDVAAHEDAVERPDGPRGWERARHAASSQKASRVEKAPPERSPEIVQVASEHDGRAMVKSAERVAREKALELTSTLRSGESEMQVHDEDGARVFSEAYP